jgi:catechol 2,3-dioxygenase-like lactoylglutathione lyase family enzyme
VTIERLSAVTLVTADMRRAVRFYRALGFAVRYGGEDASFTSFGAGETFLNLEKGERSGAGPVWGRAIFHVSDVDAVYRLALERGIRPEFPPRDASWGERYFHVLDPDGHEISFARIL